jgi:hypothetical protein
MTQVPLAGKQHHTHSDGQVMMMNCNMYVLLLQAIKKINYTTQVKE